MAAPPRQLAARPRLRPLVRVPRRRDPPVRADARTTTTTRSRRRARPRTATTSPTTSPTAPIEFLGDLRAVDAEQAVLPATSPPARATRRTTRRAEWIERYRGQFDDGLGRVARARRSRASSRSGLLPARHRAVAAAALGAGVGRRSSPRTSAVAARFMECFAGVPRRTPTRRSAGCSTFLDETRRARQHARRARVRQRRERRGRRARVRSTTCASWNGAPAGRRELRARIDEIGGPTRAQQLPVGLDDGRQHAVQALEARGARGRRRRSVHRRTGRAASRRAARSATSSRTRSTCCRRCSSSSASTRPTRSTASRSRPIDGTSFAYAARRRPTRPSATPRSTSRCSASRGIYHDGWKAVTFQPLGHMYDDGLDPDAPFDDDVWELYHVADDPSECARPRGRASRSGSRAMVDLWWEEARALPGAPARQPPARRDPQPAPTPSGDRDRYVLLRRTARRCPRPSRSTCATASHAITADGRRARRRRRPRACCSRWASVLGGWSFHVLDGRLRYVHNLYGKARDVIDVRRVIGAGAHTLGFRYEKLDDDGGRGELLVDGEVVGEGDDPDVHARRATPSPAPGSPAATSSGRRSATATTRRSASTATLHRRRRRGRRASHRVDPRSRVRGDHVGAVRWQP